MTSKRWVSKEMAYILEVESNLFAAENKYIADALKTAVGRFEVQRDVDVPSFDLRDCFAGSVSVSVVLCLSAR